MLTKYMPKDLEKKWQEKWKAEKTFSPDLDKAPKPYFALMMFPYPSAEGLHVGNMYAFTGCDIFARFMRMQGYNVFEPIGLDGFGIHSENYAIKVNKHPVELSKITEKRFYKQLQSIGNAFDWSRTVETYKPDYYRWTQWIFLQMYKNGLAYRKKAEVNWCPSCKTVLADEQVINGKCERCSSPVGKKMLEQWFFKITKYADRLLNNIEKLDWSEKVKVAQKNWIGKKEGINITYKIVAKNNIPASEFFIKKESYYSDIVGVAPSKVKKIPIASSKYIDEITCFTTRPDTNFGATFVVVAPEHPFVEKLLSTNIKVKDSKLKEIRSYVEKARAKTVMERKAEGRKKTGVFTGFYAVNQLNNSLMPVWVSDFVLTEFGTGAVVGVPGHDLRDFEFAKEFGLEIKRVVVGKDKDTSKIERNEQVQEKEGVMVNSGFLNGKDINQAIKEIMSYLENKGLGKKVVSYHLRDWLISRQRYWGPPIPIIYCKKCGTVPVPEEDLPVKLPYVENFRPTGSGMSPLASDEKFYKVKCPKCKEEARRETDVSDTFLDSAWYFLRYVCTENKVKAWSKERINKWLPVDTYIGGAEHSVLHLLYSRFLTMVFKDLGDIKNFDEPFTKFSAHGLIISNGAKMSKSKGNVVNPDKYIDEYGADTLRLYLMFLGPFELGGDFIDQAISGPHNFLKRVWDLEEKITDKKLENVNNFWMNQTIEKVAEDIKNLKFNTAISTLMEWLNYLSKDKSVSKFEYRTFLILLAPFAPHMTEEIWSHFFNEKTSIHLTVWPKTEKKILIEEEIKIPVQVNGKVRAVIEIKNKYKTDKKVITEKALENDKIQKYVNGKKYRIVYIPGKILNLVII